MKNTQFNGESETYGKGILSSKSNFKNGNTNGYRLEYYEDGTITSKAFYENGKYIEKQTFQRSMINVSA